MSAETLDTLSKNTLIGYTSKRGTAWHWRAGADNHFENEVPMDRVLDLMSYPLVEASLTATWPTELGVREGGTSPVEGKKAIVRADTGATLGIFGDGYKLHQPKEWLVDNLQILLDGGLKVGSATVLKGGAVVSVQAELEETREAIEGVKHRPFLTAATSHDGSLSTRYMVGTQVVVCDNTLAVALKEKDRLEHRIRHTSGSMSRVGEIRQALGLTVEQVGDQFDAQVRALVSQHVTDEKWDEFVKAFTGIEKAEEKGGRGHTMAQNRVDILNNLWFNDERAAPWKNSAWGVLAAANTASHHEFSVRTSNRLERNEMRTLRGEWDTYDANVLQLLSRV